MGILSSRPSESIQYDLIRRHQGIQMAADRTIEAMVALGMDRRDAAFQVNDTLQKSQRIIEKAAPHLTPERQHAIYFRVQSYLQEVLDSTARTAAKLHRLRDR